MTQIIPNVETPTIASIYKQISDGAIILQPEFQRKFVWTSEHQEAFIDTILKGLPFPEIYVCRGEVDIDNLKTTNLVVDGQQRLTTIVNYIDGKNNNLIKFKNIPPYSELKDNEKRAFLNYQIVVRNVGEVQDFLIRDIFRRINLTKFKLEDVEIHNAVYDGYFIRTAKEILDLIEIDNFPVFKETEFSRMADLYFILTVMSTLESGGYFNRDSEVENYVSRYNDEYENRDQIIKRLVSVFDFIGSLNLPPDSMWYRKSNFFSLVVEIAFNFERLPANFLDRISNLEVHVIESKINRESKYYEYYSSMYQGTQSRKARVIRSEYIKEFCFGDIT